MRSKSTYATLTCSLLLGLLLFGGCRTTPTGTWTNPNSTNAPGKITIPKPPIAYCEPT